MTFGSPFMLITLLVVPLAMLAGQVRGQVFAAMTLGRLAARAGGAQLTPEAVRDAIRDALGDSSATLALWAPERAGYVDVDGAPLELPRETPDHALTRITRDDRPVATVIHDPALDLGSDVVEALAATSLMLLENADLVEELRASRSRIYQIA